MNQNIVRTSWASWSASKLSFWLLSFRQMIRFFPNIDTFVLVFQNYLQNIFNSFGVRENLTIVGYSYTVLKLWNFVFGFCQYKALKWKWKGALFEINRFRRQMKSCERQTEERTKEVSLERRLTLSSNYLWKQCRFAGQMCHWMRILS